MTATLTTTTGFDLQAAIDKEIAAKKAEDARFEKEQQDENDRFFAEDCERLQAHLERQMGSELMGALNLEYVRHRFRGTDCVARFNFSGAGDFGFVIEVDNWGDSGFVCGVLLDDEEIDDHLYDGRFHTKERFLLFLAMLQSEEFASRLKERLDFKKPIPMPENKPEPEIAIAEPTHMRPRDWLAGLLAAGMMTNPSYADGNVLTDAYEIVNKTFANS